MHLYLLIHLPEPDRDLNRHGNDRMLVEDPSGQRRKAPDIELVLQPRFHVGVRCPTDTPWGHPEVCTQQIGRFVDVARTNSVQISQLAQIVRGHVRVQYATPFSSSIGNRLLNDPSAYLDDNDVILSNKTDPTHPHPQKIPNVVEHP